MANLTKVRPGYYMSHLKSNRENIERHLILLSLNHCYSESSFKNQVTVTILAHNDPESSVIWILSSFSPMRLFLVLCHPTTRKWNLKGNPVYIQLLQYMRSGGAIFEIFSTQKSLVLTWLGKSTKNMRKLMSVCISMIFSETFQSVPPLLETLQYGGILLTSEKSSGKPQEVVRSNSPCSYFLIRLRNISSQELIVTNLSNLIRDVKHGEKTSDIFFFPLFVSSVLMC